MYVNNVIMYKLCVGVTFFCLCFCTKEHLCFITLFMFFDESWIKFWSTGGNGIKNIGFFDIFLLCTEGVRVANVPVLREYKMLR